MARIAKYLLGAAATVVIAFGAVAVAREAGLLAGSLVVLAALIATTLVSRQIAAREERSAMADWEDVLEKDAPDDAFFSDWTATSPRAAGITPARREDELDLSAHTSAGLESLDDLAGPERPAAADELDLTDAFAAPAPDPASSDIGDPTAEAHLDAGWPPATTDPHAPGAPTVAEAPVPDEPAGVAPLAPAPADLGHDFPFDDPHDGFGDFADLPPFPGRIDEPAHEAPSAPYAPEPFSPAADLQPGPSPSPAGDRSPGGYGVPDLAPLEADAYSFAGAPAPGRSRRSVIDWSGPIHTVDEHVKSAEDILEASAATALPTPSDRPAPTGGSELARLLAKVEERLRDYD